MTGRREDDEAGAVERGRAADQHRLGAEADSRQVVFLREGDQPRPVGGGGLAIERDRHVRPGIEEVDPDIGTLAQPLQPGEQRAKRVDQRFELGPQQGAFGNVDHRAGTGLVKAEPDGAGDARDGEIRPPAGAHRDRDHRRRMRVSEAGPREGGGKPGVLRLGKRGRGDILRAAATADAEMPADRHDRRRSGHRVTRRPALR